MSEERAKKSRKMEEMAEVEDLMSFINGEMFNESETLQGLGSMIHELLTAPMKRDVASALEYLEQIPKLIEKVTELCNAQLECFEKRHFIWQHVD